MRFAGIVVVLLFFLCLSVEAQDRLAMEQVDKERDVYKGLVAGREFTGRLPNGYREVVSHSQREEIYKIQREYFDTIELLRVRIDMLELERANKIDGLLTGDQRTRIRAILGNLESERSVRRAAGTSARSVRSAPSRTPPAPTAPTPENTAPENTAEE